VRRALASLSRRYDFRYARRCRDPRRHFSIACALRQSARSSVESVFDMMVIVLALLDVYRLACPTLAGVETVLLAALESRAAPSAATGICALLTRTENDCSALNLC
jgi:hypothetical protein